MVRQSYGTPVNPVSFMMSFGNVANTFLETNQFSDRVHSRPTYNFQSSNPTVVLESYRRKVAQTNTEIERATAAQMAQAERDIYNLKVQIQQLTTSIANSRGKSSDGLNALLEGGAILADIALKEKLEKDMVQIKYNAQREAEAQLAREMGRIRDEIVGDNEKLAREYFEAAAYEVDPGKERYFLECRSFHTCVIRQINSKFSIHDDNWINTNCNKPGLYVGTHLSSPSDYIKVAYRKKSMNEKYRDDIFMDACKMYLEAGLSVNNRDPNAYALMSDMEEDLLQKKFYITMAASLDQNNREFKTKLSKVDALFTLELFSAIRQGDSRFVQRAVKNKFHLGQTYHGKTPVEQAIDYDQSDILRLLIEEMDNRQAFLNSSGYPLLFHAAAVDAVGCIRLLDTYGVPMDYTDGNNQGVTALNIAVRNGNGGASAYLYNKNENYGPCLSYASKCGQEELNDLSQFLFNRSASNIDQINSYYPDFKRNNFGNLKVVVVPGDAEVFLDEQFKGRGTVTIKDLDLGESYSLEVRKKGLKSADGKVQLKPGHITEVEVVLQEPVSETTPLLTHRTPGYELKTYHDFYVQPDNLKRDSKRNKEYNERLVKTASDKAQQQADSENLVIRSRINDANRSIRNGNNAIARNNKERDEGRLFVVNYIPDGLMASTAPVIYGSSSTHRGESTVEATSTGASRLGGGTTSSAGTSSSASGSSMTSSRFTITSTSSASKQAVDTTKPEPAVVRTSSTAASGTTRTRTRPAPEPVSKPAPLGFGVRTVSGSNGSTDLKITDNRAVDYSGSSASVLITSERGREYNFGDFYQEGIVKFYPFDGAGEYRVTVQLENLETGDDETTVQFKDRITVEQVPGDLLGSIHRVEGSFVYFKSDQDKKLFPGMQITVARFAPGNNRVIATGSVTHQAGKEWTAELFQMDTSPDKGDLVLIE